MGAIAYGHIVRRAETDSTFASLTDEAKKESKLVSTVAALVPAEILALHAWVLTRTTATDAAGTTSITDPTTLGRSLVVLAALAVVVYLIGRGVAKWSRVDLIRMLIPGVAFIVWTALIGTSALTPWVAGMAPEALVLGARGDRCATHRAQC